MHLHSFIQQIEVPNAFREMFIFHFNSDMNVAYLSSVFYYFKSATCFIV